MKQKEIGTWGENKAAEYLRNKGYRIVETGYRSRFGEIDLIAADEAFLAFVEVKTRKDKRFSLAREAIDRRKIGRIRRTAALWLSTRESMLQPRFDVIEIYAPRGADTPDPEISHLEDAFQ